MKQNQNSRWNRTKMVGGTLHSSTTESNISVIWTDSFFKTTSTTVTDFSLPTFSLQYDTIILFDILYSFRMFLTVFIIYLVCVPKLVGDFPQLCGSYTYIKFILLLPLLRKNSQKFEKKSSMNNKKPQS